MMARKKAQCIYCGQEVGRVRKGEHIVPEALGGALGIKCVCSGCNNALSDIDKELVSKSYLKFFTRAALGRVGENVWEYSEESDLALEARIIGQYQAPALWPQLIFEERAPQFHADFEELRSVAPKRYLETFLRCVRLARDTLRGKVKRPRWLWEPVKNLPRRGRFPPRVYTRHSFDELNNRIHFQCRYTPPIDKAELLWRFDEWDPFKGKLALKESLGAKDPESQTSFQPRMVLRALVKMGINLLAYVCEETPINKASFREAISFARYDKGPGPSGRDSGFVINRDIQTLDCADTSHKFRLQHGKEWRLDCAFFGGAIGATVGFPGQWREWWSRAEITTPLRSRDWTLERSKLVIPTRMRVEWHDANGIMPVVPVRNVEHGIRVERRR